MRIINQGGTIKETLINRALTTLGGIIDYGKVWSYLRIDLSKICSFENK
jgi:hypothetical protein